MLRLPRLSRLLSVALLTLVCLAAAAPSRAAEQVAVRIGEHPGYGRLVFEWASPVAYSAAMEGENLVLRFERPFTGNIDAAPRRLADYLTQPALVDDGKALIFPLKGSFGLKSYIDGRTVVVDLVKGGKPPMAAQGNLAAKAAEVKAADAKPADAKPADAKPEAKPAEAKPAEAKAAPAVADKPAVAKASAPADAPLLAVRAGDHPGFGRLVFDWPRNVDYNVAQNGGRLDLTFGAPAKIDAEALTPKLPKTVLGFDAQSDDKGLKIAMTVPENARLRHFRNGPSVVLDVLADIAEPVADKLMAQSAAKQPEAKAPAKAEAPKAETPKAQAQTKPAAAPQYELVPVDASGNSVATAAPQSLLPGAASAAPAAAPATASAQPTPLAARKLVVSTVGSGPQISGLRFAWPADAPMALFERNGSLWAVFDRAASADIANNWPRTVARPELTFSAISSILRWQMPAERFASLRRDGANLVVDFAAQPPLPGAQIPLEAQPQADAGPRVLLKSASFGPVIETRDPDVGDKLWVLPSMTAEGLTGARGFVEFQVLSSLQGAAVKALTDDLIVRPTAEGAEIVTPGGLRLSGGLAAAAPAAQAAAQVAASPATTRMPTQSGASVPLPALAVNSGTLFDFPGWAQLGGGDKASFFERKANLQRAVIDAPRAMRNPARLALARFLFASGQAADALGILQVMEEDQADVARDPAYLALRGASRYLMDDLNAAGPDLFANSLDQEREAALWRAALLAGQNDWIAANRYFARASDVLRGYPRDLQFQFGLLAAEAALSAGDAVAAKQQLDGLAYLQPQRAWQDQIDYLRGQLLAQGGEAEAALAAWDRAINGVHPPSKARARLARVEALLGNKSMKLADGIAELERLRYGWRGDDVELTVLRRLGELYIDSGDYKNGLATLRDAMTQFPKAPENAAIAQEMRDNFAQLFIGGAADKMPPLTALGIYEDFRDLTPVGDAGNLLIVKLADRLVQIELLDRAQLLLKDQIDKRLKGVPQAEAVNQLALVYLLDRKAEEALAALNAPLPAGSSPALATERRQLKARTLGELTRYKEALALLDGDTTADAARLRAEIGWRTQNWPLAAAAFTQLVPADGKGMSDAERQTVLRLAIAQSLSKDASGLAASRARYGADMAQSSFKESFEMITASDITQGFDLRSISRQVTGVDQFKAFMSSYREKIMKARGASLDGKAAPAKAAQAASIAAN